MSEALRLAELIERDYHDETLAPRMAATELRRLHTENEALREANEAFDKRQEWWNDKMVALEEQNAELVEALRNVLEVWVDDPAYGHGVIDKAWELLVKAEASK